jgi:hypothetical protein
MRQVLRQPMSLLMLERSLPQGQHWEAMGMRLLEM